MTLGKPTDPIHEGFIRLALVTPFVSHLRKRGVELAPAFSALGLSETSVGDASTFVHAEIVYGLVNAFAELAGDQFLGVHVGQEHDFSKWQPFAAAHASSRTLAEFFAAYIKRVPSEANSVEHSLVVRADRATYRVKRLHVPAVPPVQVTGFGCAHYVRILQSVTGPAWDASKVQFESRHISAVPTGYSGIETRFATEPGMLISFPVEWLFEEIKLDKRVAEGMPDQSVEEVTVVAALRSALRGRLSDSDLGANRVAGLLGLDPDRLTKALRRHGTTLPKEIKRLKIDDAKTQLVEGTNSVAQIGLSLGYSDNAHFTRFFRSQTGVSPNAYRQRSRENSRT